MTIFEPLPTTNQCCFCISLKIGSILIALHGIICAGYSAGPILSPVCDGSNELIPQLTKIFGYLLGVSELLVFIASIIFLIGIFMDKMITATIFLYAMTFFLLTSLAFFVMTLVAVSLDSRCHMKTNLIMNVVSFLITFYFIVVVKSYRGDMSD